MFLLPLSFLSSLSLSLALFLVSFPFFQLNAACLLSFISNLDPASFPFMHLNPTFTPPAPTFPANK